MSDELVVTTERYPFAQVQGAQSMQDVLEAWKERGWKPVQLSIDDLIQTVKISLNPKNGDLSWECSANMVDGLMATLLATEATFLMPSLVTAEGAISLAEYFARGEGRPDLGTGEAMVIIGFKDGKLKIDWEPKDRPIACKKLLAMALMCLLISDTQKLPMERIWELVR